MVITQDVIWPLLSLVWICLKILLSLVSQFLIAGSFLSGKPIKANSCNNQLHILVLSVHKNVRETEGKCNRNIFPNEFSRGKHYFKAENQDPEPD
jgi:hypothetical protein